ncbi:MAG TPA: TatD family hydrolase [Candidatus Bathyarchaeia archaeon]|nr:TatD family hydrolase [Candidatus Bathyarchaeia archaeon]
MNLIDTHAHLDGIEDIDAALTRAHETGVSAIVAVGEDRAANEKNLALSQRVTQPRIILALGLHPSKIRTEAIEEEFDFIERNISQAKAVGEIGLDFWYQWVRKDEGKKQEQRVVFRRLLELARRANLPALIHTRGAWREAVDIARDVGIAKAVFHWYSGPVDVLADILKAGYFISASPSVAYSPEARKALEIAPVEQTLIETDSPVYYKNCDPSTRPGHGRGLAQDSAPRAKNEGAAGMPAGLHGGFKAEPKDVAVTLRYYAALKGRSEEELVSILNRNAEKIFGL